MQKERLMALFIGSIMLMSVVGFSLANTRFGNPQQNKIDLPFMVNRELTGEELASILRSGRVVVEDFYEANCTQCPEKNAFLQTFFERFRDFVVLQIVEGNETTMKMIGAGGRIRDITDMELTDENMLDVFCEVAIMQPKECLLEQI